MFQKPVTVPALGDIFLKLYYSIKTTLTLGLVGATQQARKTSLYERSLTPRARSPRMPSVSYPSTPLTRELVSARAPERLNKLFHSSNTTDAKNQNCSNK